MVKYVVTKDQCLRSNVLIIQINILNHWNNKLKLIQLTLIY